MSGCCTYGNVSWLTVNDDFVYVAFSSDNKTEVFKYSKDGIVQDKQGFSFSSIGACSDSQNLYILAGTSDVRNVTGYITITDF